MHVKCVHVKCDRPTCLHEWDYKGKSKHKATCPMCRKVVNISTSPGAETKEEETKK